ncbi:hypothetical protein CGU37_27310, partial [Pseudomonas fluorescens]
MGIRGQILRNFKVMYDEVFYRVKANGLVTEDIRSNIGLMQGDGASPTGYNIFSNDLGDALGEEDQSDSPDDVPK